MKTFFDRDLLQISQSWFCRIPDKRQRELALIVFPDLPFEAVAMYPENIYKIYDRVASSDGTLKLDGPWLPLPKSDFTCTKYMARTTGGQEIGPIYFAQDLSGEEQPPFSGWFIPVADSQGRHMYNRELNLSTIIAVRALT